MPLGSSYGNQNGCVSCNKQMELLLQVTLLMMQSMIPKQVIEYRSSIVDKVVALQIGLALVLRLRLLVQYACKRVLSQFQRLQLRLLPFL